MLLKEEREEVQKRLHRSACFQRVFDGTDGKLVLDEVDKISNYKIDTFDPDPYISAYRAGQRSVSVFIHNVINQDVEKAKRILEEGAKHEV